MVLHRKPHLAPCTKNKKKNENTRLNSQHINTENGSENGYTKRRLDKNKINIIFTLFYS